MFICAVKRLFVISSTETKLARRGFMLDGSLEETRNRLELIGREFLSGYAHALNSQNVEELYGRCNSSAIEVRGFDFEGAAMACALLDILMPGRHIGRTFSLFKLAGAKHEYLLYVGVGWAYARLSLHQNSFKSTLLNSLGGLRLLGRALKVAPFIIIFLIPCLFGWSTTGSVSMRVISIMQGIYQ